MNNFVQWIASWRAGARLCDENQDDLVDYLVDNLVISRQTCEASALLFLAICNRYDLQIALPTATVQGLVAMWTILQWHTDQDQGDRNPSCLRWWRMWSDQRGASRVWKVAARWRMMFFWIPWVPWIPWIPWGALYRVIGHLLDFPSMSTSVTAFPPSGSLEKGSRAIHTLENPGKNGSFWFRTNLKQLKQILNKSVIHYFISLYSLFLKSSVSLASWIIGREVKNGRIT